MWMDHSLFTVVYGFTPENFGLKITNRDDVRYLTVVTFLDSGKGAMYYPLLLMTDNLPTESYYVVKNR
jgi:hypothetical protein